MRPIDADRLIEDMGASCLPIMEKGISEITGDESCIVDHINAAPTIDAVQMAQEIKRQCKEHTECHYCVFCGHSMERICLLSSNIDKAPEDWNLPEGGEAHDAPG